MDTNTRTDELAQILALLLADTGVEAPSSRRIAAGMPLSIGTLYGHFETRDRLLGVLADRVGSALTAPSRGALVVDGVAALLPSDDDTDVLTRAWLGLVEVGRCHETVGYAVARVLAQEESALIVATDHHLAHDRERLELLHALLHGLRSAVTRRDDPLDLETARRMLSGYADQLVEAAAAEERSAPIIASGSSAE